MPVGKNWYLFIFFMCLALAVSAQQADFSADKTSGCSPLAISFTNHSTGFSSAAVYSWDFGNTNSSALENPGTTYNDEGIYTVTLTVTDGGQKSSKSIQVTVYKKPVVDFAVDITKGCAPLAVTFTSHSEAGDGTISAYTWDFGDGIAEAGDGTLVHTYNIAKTISPSLTVTNSYGCYNTLSKPQLIEVLPQVIAAFTPDRNVLCTVQDAVSFTNTSAGTGTLSYQWEFGDGNTSTTAQPQHTYSQPGRYTVKLTATSKDGCVSDTILNTPVNVADYHTRFNVPDIICQNTLTTFTDISTPTATTEQWRIDGTAVIDTTANQLQQVFATPGEHHIQLINTYETCPDSADKKITVLAAPTAGFIAKLQGSCGAPVTVDFRDTTNNATAWQWDFGSGSTASGQTASHLYDANGTYSVTLTATNANGCSAQLTQPVEVHKATVSIASSEGDLGCETKTTIFSALTEANLTQFDWDFGDGTPHSAEATPSHTFTSPGHYTISLGYITSSGCAGKTQYTLDVYERPKFDFTATPGTTICGSNPVSFLVSGSNLAGQYFWDFGDGKGYTTPPPPYTHSYRHDSVYTVSLVINNNGCTDTVTKKNYLTVLPPFPHIASALNTCDGIRDLVTFTDTSQKAEQYSWDFGDGTAPSVYNAHQVQVQHHYKASGTYHITLTATNGNCSAIDSASVFVLLKQKPVLSAGNTTFCSNDVFLTTISGIDANPYTGNDALGYKLSLIQYKDGTAFTGNSSIADSTGQTTFGVNLTDVNVNETALRIITASNHFGCADTTNYLSFQALGPIAGFTVADNKICFKTPAVFTDASHPSHNSPIVKWDWQFGDSLSQVNIQGTKVAHPYDGPGIYHAVLTVTDAKGCSDSTSVDDGIITVTGPKAAFSISENPVLPATSVSFYNQTITTNTNNGDNQYTWNYGDGAGIKNQPYTNQVSHIYSHESNDTVSLIAFNTAESCADTAVQIVYVKNPNLSFTYTTTYVNPDGGCPPVIASFVNTSINTTKVSWDFGDGSTADNLDNAGHIYDKPGIYKVTLYGYFLDGTIDSVFQMVTIKGPFAELKTVKPFACGAELITLTAASSNTKNFTWDFGDGTLLNNSDTFAEHRYLTAGVYTPSLIVSDGNNCKFPFFLTKPIIIDTLHLTINTNALVACDSSVLLFTPAVVSEAKTLGLPLSYHWDFGTGNGRDTANTESTSFTYNHIGTYEVTLSGASPYGCIDITSDTIVVQPTPKAYIAGPAQLCEDDSAAFTGSSTSIVTWHWQFGNGDVSLLKNTPDHQFTTPGIDSVSLVVNDKGCYDTAWHPVLVHARPVINPSPLTARLCQGDSVQLEAHDGVLYQWTPNEFISGAGTASPYVFPDTATLYFVTVKNENGCVSNDSIAIDVTQRFRVVTPSPVYICPGGVAQLNASGADKYHWLDNNVSNPDVANPTASVYTSKLYTVVGADKYSCFTDTASTQVLTAALPTVNAGMDATTFAGVPVQLLATASNDVVRWQWIPDTYIDCDSCAAISVTPHADIQYVVQVTNRSGCVAYDSVQVHILCKTSLVRIPSAFTPNSDGRNDRFTVTGSGIKEIRHFAVFDRLGEELFETTNLSVGETSYTGWDGTYKNKPMPPGTYVYIAELVCDTGELFTYKGTVVLIR